MWKRGRSKFYWFVILIALTFELAFGLRGVVASDRLLRVGAGELKEVFSSNTETIVDLKNIPNGTSLEFLSNFNSEWKLYLVENSSQEQFPWRRWTYLINSPIFDKSHRQVEGYANGWVIDTGYIQKSYPEKYFHQNSDGTLNFKLVVFFLPQVIFEMSLIISGVTLGLCVGYLLASLVRGRMKALKKYD